jgi:hypothetical protein
MNKTKITLVILGNLRQNLDFKKLKRFRSKYFMIADIEKITDLPEPFKDDGYLDVTYSRDDVIEIMNRTNNSELILGLINYRFTDNFYLHRTCSNKACLSIADIDVLLQSRNISIENFILKNIYEIVTFKYSLGTLVDNESIYKFLHRDTRGCLFDMNGDKYDVIYNTEKPKICDACRASFNGTSLPEKYISNLEKELKRLKRPLILRIELFIKKYPLFSILLTFLSTVLINIVSNIIWEIVK